MEMHLDHSKIIRYLLVQFSECLRERPCREAIDAT